MANVSTASPATAVDFALSARLDPAEREVGVVLPVQRPLSLHLDTTYYPTRYSEARAAAAFCEGPCAQLVRSKPEESHRIRLGTLRH